MKFDDELLLFTVTNLADDALFPDVNLSLQRLGNFSHFNTMADAKRYPATCTFELNLPTKRYPRRVLPIPLIERYAHVKMVLSAAQRASSKWH
jgi:hypothetical protein